MESKFANTSFDSATLARGS